MRVEQGLGRGQGIHDDDTGSEQRNCKFLNFFRTDTVPHTVVEYPVPGTVAVPGTVVLYTATVVPGTGPGTVPGTNSTVSPHRHSRGTSTSLLYLQPISILVYYKLIST